MKPNLFEYEDYRKYLRDLYDFLKKTQASFSFRFFSRQAGFASPNFLKLVMNGSRNLTRESIPKFSRALKLSQEEAHFFEHLVLFNQATTPEDKNDSFEQMSHNRKFRQIRKVEKDQFQFYSRWYYSAVRELVAMEHFVEEPEWIAHTLLPKISTKQATDAIHLLLNLKLIERDEKGRLRQTDTNITTGAEVRSLAVRNFHIEMIEQAKKSLDSMNPLDRDISSVTLGVPASKIKELKDKVAQFRKELLASIGSAQEKPDQVVQLNMQLFPLSRRKK